jgi:hypothetical protein
MGGTLLVADQKELEGRTGQFVEKIQDSSAWKTEQGFHSRILQGINCTFRTASHRSLSSSESWHYSYINEKTHRFLRWVFFASVLYPVRYKPPTAASLPIPGQG